MAFVVAANDLITIAEAKLQLRIGHSEDDDLIGALIKAATIHMVSYLRAPVSAGLWRQVFGSGATYLCLDVIAVDPIAVTYRDLDGVEQVFTDFTVQHFADFSSIEAVDVWPDATSFAVEYGVQAPDIPDPLKVAALMHVASLYENPTATSDGASSVLPLGYKELIAPFRRF